MFIGGGESPGSLYATLTTSTTEHLFCTADNTVYIEANANTIANRIGIAIDTSGAIVPVKAEAANNNKQNIGASDNKFASIYATTFIGALNGNADSATQVKVTGVSLPSSGNVIYYLTYAGSTTTGNQDIKDCARLYLFENTTASYLNIGSASTSGGITVHNANGKYSDIVSSAFSANRVITLPDQTGTIALLTKTDINALINLLDTGSSVLTADDYIITQYVGGGTTTTTYHRRAAKNVRVGGLTTARSLWGNDFDGTAAINGHIKLGSSKHIYMNYNSTDYAILYNHNNGNVSLRAAGAGLYIAYADTTFVNWMNGRMELRDGCLSLFPNNTSYREGLRIHATSSWSDITLCGNDNTGNSGTSANSWLIGNNNGNFYITRNGSSSGTAWLGCVGNVWKIYGNQSNSKSKQQSILHIYGGTCGNTAADMISGTAGLFSWGDGGPQITFDTNVTPGGGQAGALIFTDNDTAATGVSWHFVSNQTDWNVTSKRFHARTSISIGTDLPSTSYNLSVTGTSYFSSTTTLGGDLLFSNSATATRQIRGVVGDNDYWRIAGGATAANAGWMEIATADDGNEPIYVRQYTGAYTTITRTATLLDANGNSSFPGNITCIGAPQTVTAANMAFNGGVQLREVGAVGNAQSAIEYGPRLSFHWANRVAKSITLHSDGKFYFRDQNGTTRSTIDANLTGTADVASKLGTANVGHASRPIYLAAGVPTATTWYHSSCSISGGNKANYPWHRFAYCTTGTGNYTDKSVIIILHSRFDGGQYGMVKLSMRTNSAGASKSTSAVWIYRKGFAADDIKISAPTQTTGTDETISAYIRCSTYPRRIAYILEGSNLGWALVSSNEPNDTTASDKKGGTEINASVSGNNATDGTTVAYLNCSRVTKNVNEHPGKNITCMQEFSNTSSNLPSSHFYYVLEAQGDDTAYSVQLAMGETTSAIYYRAIQNNTYNGWNRIVTNSGSWSISVTGSSGSCTGNAVTATTASTLAGGLATNDVSGSSYGNLKVTTAKGGYYGFLVGTSTSCMNVMSSGQHNGLYCQAKGRWMFYYDSTNDRCAIGSSSTTANYILTVGGDTYINGNLKGNTGKTIGTTAIADHWNKLYLGGATADSRALNSANPLIEFADSDRSQYAQIVYTDYNNQGGSDSITFVSNQNDLRVYAPKVHNAVWNDYAETRATDITEPGRVVTENGKTMTLANKRLLPGCRIISDTYGTCMGREEDTPIAVSGRVLVYPYRNCNDYPLGAAVCSAPNGTVDVMTREEIINYPERIIGTVSEIPDYEYWGAGQDGKLQITVNGRIWIYVR